MTIFRLSRSARTLVALAALLFGPCTTVSAQQARGADLKLINDCLKRADKTGDLGTACVGLIADACTRKADNDVAKSKACAERELAIWTIISEAAGKRVRAGGFKEISKALAESEKGWTQQRNTLCAVFDQIEPGTLPGDAAYCRMQATANRALLLRRLGAAVNEH